MVDGRSDPVSYTDGSPVSYTDGSSTFPVSNTDDSSTWHGGFENLFDRHSSSESMFGRHLYSHGTWDGGALRHAHPGEGLVSGVRGRGTIETPHTRTVEGDKTVPEVGLDYASQRETGSEESLTTGHEGP